MRFRVDPGKSNRGHTMISAEVLGDLLCSTRNSTQELVDAVKILIDQMKEMSGLHREALEASKEALEAARDTQRKIAEAVEALKETGSAGDAQTS